jgi:4-carboxymuconolactone decarboxylase
VSAVVFLCPIVGKKDGWALKNERVAAEKIIFQEVLMAKLPTQYVGMSKRYKKYFNALNSLGKAAKSSGPIDERTAQLIQLAGAAVIRSEGAVHSHTRRALEAGAEPEELYHALLLLTSTIGFPTVSAAISWIDDVLAKQGR